MPTTAMERRASPPTTDAPQEAVDAVPAQRICSGCYLTEAEWNKTGLFGCSRCYETFAETIVPAMVVLHGVRVPEEWARPKARRTITLPWATRRGIRI